MHLLPLVQLAPAGSAPAARNTSLKRRVVRTKNPALYSAQWAVDAVRDALGQNARACRHAVLISLTSRETSEFVDFCEVNGLVAWVLPCLLFNM